MQSKDSQEVENQQHYDAGYKRGADDTLVAFKQMLFSKAGEAFENDKDELAKLLRDLAKSVKGQDPNVT